MPAKAPGYFAGGANMPGVHKKLIVARKAEAIRAEPPPLPNRGPYRVIVADPPT